MSKYDRFWFAVATEFAALYEQQHEGNLELGNIDYRIRDITFGSGESTFTDTARVRQVVPMPERYPDQPVLLVEFEHPLLDTAEAIHKGTLPIHFEWRDRPAKDQAINISVHFEFTRPNKNLAFRDLLSRHIDVISTGIDLEFGEEPFTRKKGFRFLEPYTIQHDPRIAPRLALVMKQLIERTWPIIRACLDGPNAMTRR